MQESQRYKLTLAYRGTAYHGWQIQTVPPTWKGAMPDEGAGIPTVQEALRLALIGVLNHPVVVVGSSRTDTGVHAKGQVAHFDTVRTQIPIDRLKLAINHRLPPDILIRSIEPVPRAFDAIASTRSKRYQYAVWNHPDRPVFAGDLWFHRWQSLDLDAMRAAAAHFVGEQDFASFCKPGHGRESTVRTVFAADVSRVGPKIVMGFEGSGFLWNQVRVMAGTLIEVGEGIYTPDQIPQMLAAKDRRRAGKTAPAHGLFLQWIQFKPTETKQPTPSGL